MTKVHITKRNKSISVIECDGHTNYGEKGEDIVCAALSSIVQTAVLGILQVAGVSAKMERNDDKGYLKVIIPENLSIEKQKEVDIITNTMLLGVADLYEGFSDFIELEVK